MDDLLPSTGTLTLARAFVAWLEKSRFISAGDQGTDLVRVFSFDGVNVTFDAVGASCLIRAGLRAGAIDELIPLLGLTRKADLSRELNVTRTRLRNLARSDKPLPTTVIEKILRNMHMHLLATDVFGGVDPARAWLRRPHPSLGGVSPADYADNEYGAQKVRGILAALKYTGAS